MRKTIYLIRHAESEKNKDPLSDNLENRLTAIGIKQAHRLARKLQSKPLDKIFTSNSLRATETAKILHIKTRIEPIELEYIFERKCAYQNNEEFTYTESFEDLKIRLAKTKIFLEESEFTRVAMVSHAGFIKALSLYLILGELFDEELLKKTESGLILNNTGMAKLVYNIDKKKWLMDSWNEKNEIQ